MHLSLALLIKNYKTYFFFISVWRVHVWRTNSFWDCFVFFLQCWYQGLNSDYILAANTFTCWANLPASSAEFLFLFYVSACFAWVYVSTWAWCLQKPEEWIASSGTGIKDRCKPSCGCWEANLGLAQGHLTTVLSQIPFLSQNKGKVLPGEEPFSDSGKERF